MSETIYLSKPGNLVHARGREWVVLPNSTENLLMVRPVGGLDEEITGILPEVEEVQSAQFRLPTIDDAGDFTCGQILREAARLSTRAAAGPFRSFGRIAVEPRPYQLVPLMMALRLDPIRILIADDVGIGKTIEAGLILREMIDRAELGSFSVLCPPPLAQQWQQELARKFHIEAELILSSTIQRLERDLPIGRSVFDQYPFTIVSTDFIKSAHRADDFIRCCPEMVIVDEAHTCTLASGVGHGRQQRFDLLRRISQEENRHLILVTATPHSGNEKAFRSLLSLLQEDFADLPEDLDREEREGARRRLARHLVQRRRADICDYLDDFTPFPQRLDAEMDYTFSPEYRQLFEDIIAFARSYVQEDAPTDLPTEGHRRKHIRYWSALAMLRCVSSSPAAASATLRTRAAVDEAQEEQIDEIGARTVLDQSDDDDTITLDFSPGSETEKQTSATQKQLRQFAQRADAITPSQDRKLQGLLLKLQQLLRDGFQPVVFCRFIDTAEYLARNLRGALPQKVRIEAVTGLLPPSEREARIAGLAEEGGEYILICTDCLSEGINLQHHFNAVIHYDLAWNPTRHEQREGRVDRFGQERDQVRVVTYYGKDNPIDGVILDVLIRKHKTIKNDLGVAVAVPGTSEQIAQALFEGALFREQAKAQGTQMRLDFFEPSRKKTLHAQWEDARQREKISRSRFAQHTIRPEEVATELERVRHAIGGNQQVARFIQQTLQTVQVPVEQKNGALLVALSPATDRSLRQALGRDEPFQGRFELPLQKGEIYLGRTSPIVEGLAGWVIDQALDSQGKTDRSIAARCGAFATSLVSQRTILMILRLRYHLQSSRFSQTLLCEEILPMGCRGPIDTIQWLDPQESERLLPLTPERNLLETAMKQQLSLLMADLPTIQSALKPLAHQRAQIQLEAHQRVRHAMRTKATVSIEPVLPVDILGAWVLLPTGTRS